MSKINNSKLKIGLVLDDTLDNTNGVQQYVLSVGDYLISKGHEVHYLVGQSNRMDIVNVHSLSRNIKVNFNGNKLSIPLPANSKKITSLIKELNLDVVHVQMPYSPFMSGKVIDSINSSTALIGTFHILPFSKSASLGTVLLGAISKSTSRRFDKILAVSEPAKELASNMYKAKVDILGNSFDFNFYNKHRVKKSSKRLELLFLGRLVKRKGCQDLLHALSIIERSVSDLPEYYLSIVGDGPLMGELKDYVLNNNLENKVVFKGYVSEEVKADIYANSDIAIFPSKGGESFGIVLIEAMANGHTAVIAADNQGYKNLLKGNPDALFTASDEVALARKLKEVMLDPILRNNLALRGLKLASSYDKSIIGSKLMDNYRQALLKRRP